MGCGLGWGGEGGGYDWEEEIVPWKKKKRKTAQSITACKSFTHQNVKKIMAEKKKEKLERERDKGKERDV